MSSRKFEVTKMEEVEPKSGPTLEDNALENAKLEPCTPSYAAKAVAKVLAVLGLLYFFICSLDLMSIAFRLVLGKSASTVLAGNPYLSNPLFGLMIGIMGTVAVQSSSTFTSIVIALVASTALAPEQAVAIIIGSNIGTSVTNTIVSFTQAADRDTFRRAFSAATVHDMFNWCAVLVLLPLEIATNFLYNIALSTANAATGGGADVDPFGAIIDPFLDLIVQIDSDVLNCWASGGCQNDTLLVKNCSSVEEVFEECDYLFALIGTDDFWTGLILVIVSLITLCVALLLMVKILNSLLKGAIAVVIKKVLNPKWENPVVAYLWGYFNIAVGGAMTFIVQSSSVFTSTLTPLVGIGLIEIETVYPLFLGSNIGTTTTAILASLASGGEGDITNALQVGFVHMYFNLIGIAIFYPIPILRVPIVLCKILGNTTAKYRWFAVFYLVFMFLIVPGFFMAISLNIYVMVSFLVPILVILVFVIVVNVMQNYERSREWLPEFLRDWDFLPKFMHSLEPYDRIFTGCRCCKKCTELSKDDGGGDIELTAAAAPCENDAQETAGKKGAANDGFESD